MRHALWIATKARLPLRATIAIRLALPRIAEDETRVAEAVGIGLQQRDEIGQLPAFRRREEVRVGPDLGHRLPRQRSITKPSCQRVLPMQLFQAQSESQTPSESLPSQGVSVMSHWAWSSRCVTLSRA